MALGLVGYGPEHSDRDVARLDGVIDKLLDHMKVFDNKKVSAEDIKEVEVYKNCSCAVAREISVKMECLVASGRTAAQRRAIEREAAGQKRKSA